jgi:hypothetical protein
MNAMSLAHILPGAKTNWQRMSCFTDRIPLTHNLILQYTYTIQKGVLVNTNRIPVRHSDRNMPDSIMKRG